MQETRARERERERERKRERELYSREMLRFKRNAAERMDVGLVTAVSHVGFGRERATLQTEHVDGRVTEVSDSVSSSL